MPDFLGRSVYLTEFEKQKAPLAAGSAGGAPVFISLHIGEEFAPDYPDRVRAMCSWLREHGWRILADVSEQTAIQFGCGDILQLARDLGLWGLRLDDGFTLEEACSLAARMPIAVNASILVGYHLAGIPGALVAVVGTVLPPLIILSVISVAYTAFQNSLIVQLVLRAMQAGVAAVIADVVISMGWDVLKKKLWLPILIMFGSFIAACFFDVNVILIILVCAVIGLAATLHDEKNGKAGE